MTMTANEKAVSVVCALGSKVGGTINFERADVNHCPNSGFTLCSNSERFACSNRH